MDKNKAAFKLKGVPIRFIIRKYEKIWSDTSIYTEFRAGVDSDGQNPSKICQ